MTHACLSGRRALLATALLVTAGCTFPDYILPGETAGSTTSSAGGAGTTGSTTPTSSSTVSAVSTSSVGGATAASTSASSTTGSAMGPTCSQTCDTSNMATCSAVCAGSDPECDCDDDGEIADTPACKASHPTATVDCYDCNAAAKHGVTAYFIYDRGDGDFDYNCSNIEEPQYTDACGEGTTGSCSKPFRYATTPGCGKLGDLFACTVPVLQCQKAATSNPTPQACH